MQKISFGNRDYVKASEIAKQFRYTQDYVGQLCRGDKVDARLVGRVWYVNPESVTSYRKTKHATQKKTVKPTQTKRTPKKRSKVEPVVRNKTVRSVSAKHKIPVATQGRNIAISYDSDTDDVIPVLAAGRKNASTSTARSPKVKIKVRPETRKGTSYYAEKIPEITLQAKLKVNDDFSEKLNEEAADTEPLDPAAVTEPATEDTNSSLEVAQTGVSDDGVVENPEMSPDDSVAGSDEGDISDSRASRAHKFAYLTVCAAALVASILVLGSQVVYTSQQNNTEVTYSFDLTFLTKLLAS